MQKLWPFTPKSSLNEYPVFTEGRQLAPHLSLYSGVGRIRVLQPACISKTNIQNVHKSDIKVEFWKIAFPGGNYLWLHRREFRIKDSEHESSILWKPTPPHMSTFVFTQVKDPVQENYTYICHLVFILNIPLESQHFSLAAKSSLSKNQTFFVQTASEQGFLI